MISGIVLDAPVCCGGPVFRAGHVDSSSLFHTHAAETMSANVCNCTTAWRLVRKNSLLVHLLADIFPWLFDISVCERGVYERMAMRIPDSWQHVLAGEIDKPYFKKLEMFVEEERRTQTVFPPEDDVFNALKFTPYDRVNV